jgi:hypothetical protein
MSTLKPVVLTGSYLQGNKHANVSAKYNPIQASAVGDAMQSHGLTLSSLSTGRAKHEDKADFQRTLSRYRGPELFQENGKPVHLEVIYDSKHMGRGVDRILLGIYRMVCTNGLFVGKNFFTHEIRHNGATYDNLNVGIAAALNMASKLAQTVQRMQTIQLNDAQKEAFALEAVKLLTPDSALQVRHRLLAPKRAEDTSNDLWTVYNVVQENAMQGRSVGYTLQSLDAFGRPSTRAMTARAIKPNSGKDADFNQALFEVAEKIAA